MIECKEIDNDIKLTKIGTLQLTSTFRKGGYAYLERAEQLLIHYLEELPIRIEKSKNAEKFPDLALVSKHLIDMKHIIE